MEPHEALLVAIIGRALRDVCSRNEKNRASALAWLNGSGAEIVCDWLGLDVGTLRRECMKFRMGERNEKALHGKRL